MDLIEKIKSLPIGAITEVREGRGVWRGLPEQIQTSDLHHLVEIVEIAEKGLEGVEKCQHCYFQDVVEALDQIRKLKVGNDGK